VKLEQDVLPIGKTG